MKLALIASILLFFILPASALIPADNISDNKSYVAEPNTNTNFTPENHEAFISEITPQTTATITPLQPTTTLTPSSCCSSGSSGGGSGSGGVISTENFSNIVKYETHEGTLIAGQPVSFKFNLSVYEVILTGKQNEEVTLRVELLKDLPQKATVKPQGEVISYFNVVMSKRVKTALIRLGSVSPIEAGVWNNTQWEYLPSVDDKELLDTLSKNPDDGNLYYTYRIADPKKVMSFAIVNLALEQPKNTIDAIPTPLPTIIPIPLPTSKQSSGFGAGLVLVAFLIVVLRKR